MDIPYAVIILFCVWIGTVYCKIKIVYIIYLCDEYESIVRFRIVISFYRRISVLRIRKYLK